VGAKTTEGNIELPADQRWCLAAAHMECAALRPRDCGGFSSVARAPTSATEPSVLLKRPSHLEQSADGCRTAGIVIQPFQIVAEEVSFVQWDQTAV